MAAAAAGGGGSVNPFLSDSEEDEPEEPRAGGGSSSSTEPGGPAYPQQQPEPAAGSPEELPGLRAAAPGDAAAGAGELPRVPMDAIAAQLLRDQFLLTALELHTELLESGRELPRLRDFFSNPGNFERQSGTPPAGGALGSLGGGSGLGGAGGREPGAGQLNRAGSISTLDSLDFARYSDDGNRETDERVAGFFPSSYIKLFTASTEKPIKAL